MMLARLRYSREFAELLDRMDGRGVPRSEVTYSQIMANCKSSKVARRDVRMRFRPRTGLEP